MTNQVSEFKRKRFIKMYHCELAIIGFIDANNCVHSKEYNPMGSTVYHDGMFGCHICRWRWDLQTGLHAFGGMSTEERTLVAEYLTRKYSIPFYENGYHNWEYIAKIAKS